MKIVQVVDNQPKVSHKIIVEYTKNNEESILRLIRDNEKYLKKFGSLGFTDFKSLNGGRPKKEYFLNESQATLLITFMRNNETVINFKVLLVQEFFKMRENLTKLKNLNQTRVNLKDSKVREAFYIAFDGKCYYSKESLNKSHFHIDHILPKSKGGEDILCNLVVCKPDINIKKSNSYDETFVNQHQSYVSEHIAPKIEKIINMLDSNQNLDLKYLFNAGVMGKLIELYGKESIKELYANLIPNLNYKESQNEKNLTTEYFIKNCVVSKKGKRLSASDLYETYSKFCFENQISNYNRIQFFRVFREIKNVPKMNLLRVGLFEGKRKRYFKDMEVIL
jgi:phage regulator Rha-like protein